MHEFVERHYGKTKYLLLDYMSSCLGITDLVSLLLHIKWNFSPVAQEYIITLIFTTSISIPVKLHLRKH